MIQDSQDQVIQNERKSIKSQNKETKLLGKRKCVPLSLENLQSLQEIDEYTDEFSTEQFEQKNKQNPIELVKVANINTYGNYDNYYKYRYDEKWQDVRLEYLGKEYFLNKRCLDIGCNDGSLTIMLAIKYFPENIVGIDIDYSLINKAIHNLKYFENQSNQQKQENPENVKAKELLEKLKKMPKSFQMNLCGNVEDENILLKNKVIQDYLANINNQSILQVNQENDKGKLLEIKKRFPSNIEFRIENYVQSMDIKEEYETILCLSLTKWIQFNWGDVGVRRLFKKAYDQLVPGGYFILEPQDWRSYKKRKYLTEEFKVQYKHIQMRPNDYQKYLVNRLGFILIQQFNLKLQEDTQLKEGFKRNIYIYQKPYIHNTQFQSVTQLQKL